MGRLRRKRTHNNDTHLKKKYRTRKRTKDLDQIHADMVPTKAAKLLSQETDTDLPGCGQFYCLQCARYFIDDKALKDHIKSRVHKKRLRMLKEVPYTVEESQQAGGMGSYTLTSTRPLTSQQQEVTMENKDSENTIAEETT